MFSKQSPTKQHKISLLGFFTTSESPAGEKHWKRNFFFVEQLLSDKHTKNETFERKFLLGDSAVDPLR
jgi:hypothetical protein